MQCLKILSAYFYLLLLSLKINFNPHLLLCVLMRVSYIWVVKPGIIFMTYKTPESSEMDCWGETCQGTPQFSCIHYLFLCPVMFSPGNLLKIYIFASNAVILSKCFKMSRSDGKWRWVKKENLFLRIFANCPLITIAERKSIMKNEPWRATCQVVNKPS